MRYKSKYKVMLIRVGYAQDLFEVEARTYDEAEAKALELAKTHTFVEHDKEYRVDYALREHKTGDKFSFKGESPNEIPD